LDAINAGLRPVASPRAFAGGYGQRALERSPVLNQRRRPRRPSSWTRPSPTGSTGTSCNRLRRSRRSARLRGMDSVRSAAIRIWVICVGRRGNQRAVQCRRAGGGRWR
jgi:hypothetical protein